MSFRQRTGSMMCPSCNQLVGVNDEACYSCGRKRPGMFGFSSVLGGLKLDDVLVPLVMGVCVALYLATLVSGGMASESGGGFMSFLAPSGPSLFLFGASGVEPVFRYGRWWTVLSAGWLHGNLIHIGFNLMALRDLLPLTTHLYGPSRTLILYTVSGVTGFVSSTLVGHLLPNLWMRGGVTTLGASASVFGLLGAMLYYGRRGGSSMIGEAAKRWILGGLLFGLMLPGIVDNWAHLGGLAGGYAAGRFLDPLHPERGDHAVIALLCLALSAAAVLASVLTGRSAFA